MKGLDKLLLLLIVMMVTFFGCNTKPPISVELISTPLPIKGLGDVRNLDITSIQDEVVIESIIINRGNCSANSDQELPHTLKFGEIFKTNNCTCSDDIIEAEIKTDKGSFVFNF